MARRYNNILDLIGHTPLVPVNKINPNPNVEIMAKLESFNPGGSVKDRPALTMIEEAERKGELTRDKMILEATSGNTGIGLSLVASVKGYRILLVMSESVSEERKKILRAMGAELEFTPAHMGTDGAIEFVYDLVRKDPDKYWLADQFNNEANWMAHYHGTAMEIWEETQGAVDAVVATMGTTGTLMGLARRFRELNPEVQVIGIEPYMGHKIQGLKNMKESYRPGIFDKTQVSRIMNIEDEEAFHTARELARKEGLFVGMSSGAAMAGALRLAGEMKRGRIVAILPDGGERYLSTTLFTDKKKSGLFLYNTLNRKKEEFIPIQEDQVTMYTCGPTLCQMIHIGQARRFVFADLLRRYLEYRGFHVTYIMNVTDLDDRTIEGSDRAGMRLEDFTELHFREFMKDLESLRVKKASDYPRASRYLDEMVQMTHKILEKGYAYEKFRSVYFDISRFSEYGKLSRIDLDKIQVGKTVDLEQYEKENPRDFTLLKRSTLSELKKGIFCQTQWGNVRPSWHLECPAMAIKILGPTHDIHTGGTDLVFPHHENATAIAHALTGKPLANYWLHNELVMVEGKKPPRGIEPSLYTVRSLLENGYAGRVIRYWLMSHHYRRAIAFSMEKLDTAGKTILHLDQFTRKLLLSHSGPSHPEIDQYVYDLRYKFAESMDDDLGISSALAALFEFSRQVNPILDRTGLSRSDREKVEECLRGINSVLDILDLDVPQADKRAEDLIRKREEARRNKDWATADRMRDELRRMGVEVTDSKTGPIWRREGTPDT